MLSTFERRGTIRYPPGAISAISLALCLVPDRARALTKGDPMFSILMAAQKTSDTNPLIRSENKTNSTVYWRRNVRQVSLINLLDTAVQGPLGLV